MMKNGYRKIVGVLMALLMGVLPVQALAASSTESVAAAAEARLSSPLVAKFDPFVTYSERNGYTLVGTPKGATADEISAVKAQLVNANKIAAALREVNEAAARGEVKDGTRSYRNGKAGILSNGRQEMVSYWWGFYLYMDHDHTQDFAYALGQGGSWATIAGALVAMFPGLGAVPGALVAVAGGLMQIGASAINRRDQGRGVRIKFVFGVPVQVSSQ